jgi:hypothetical protein
MVAMNLGVVALPAIELRNLVVGPLRVLLHFVGVLRKDLTSAVVNEPAGGADVAACEVPPLSLTHKRYAPCTRPEASGESSKPPTTHTHMRARTHIHTNTHTRARARTGTHTHTHLHPAVCARVHRQMFRVSAGPSASCTAAALHYGRAPGGS